MSALTGTDTHTHAPYKGQSECPCLCSSLRVFTTPGVYVSSASLDLLFFCHKKEVER